MTTDKDFKRIVRRRMLKTGESYTAARANLLRIAPAGAAPDYAKLAGFSDQVIKARTGCDWSRWVKALDHAGAHEWPHREIARYVREKYHVPAWWTQAVTVGYERIKGLRAIGQRRDGGYEASKSRTYPVSLGRLYRGFSSPKSRARWLPGVKFAVRTAIKDRSMRMTWPDGTSVAVFFLSKGAGKSAVQVQHGKLPDKAAADRLKAYWAERLGALAEILA